MPAHGLPVVDVDMDTVSKDSTGTQEVVHQDKVVLQERVVLQGVRHDRRDCRELRGLQGALGSETVEVPQTDRQGDQGRREVWVHVEGSLLVPEVGVDEVVEGQSRCCRLRRCHRGSPAGGARLGG